MNKEDHLNRKDRNFYFADKVTYIERQDITVQSGAVFHNGPAPVENQQEEQEAEILESNSAQQNFAFMKHWGHSEEELAAAMESLRVRCLGNNSRSVMRFLVDLDKEGFIDISEVKAAELYEELCRSFGMPNIKKNTFSEAFRVMG